MDNPPQKHSTSVVKATNNPFWDEHFLFDLEESTQQIKFDVYDREKPPGTDMLGSASVGMEDIRHLPSSRQILPLQGASTATRSSITVEFLFMEPAESQSLSAVGQQGSDVFSPRRQIETQRRLTPGGTMVTTTTTTTERSKDRMDPAFNESPNLVQKTEMSPDYSPSSGSSNNYGVNDSPSQDPLGGRAYGGSPKLTVTRPGQRVTERSSTMPVHMPEAGVNDDMRDMQGLPPAQGLSERPSDMKKKGFGAALKKRFSRNKKPRSHSADRASSFRDEHLLKPPEQGSSHTTGDGRELTRDYDEYSNPEFPESNLRKSRSHSFSSSLRKIFRKKKKDPYASSRESSVSRMSNRGYDMSREGSMGNPSPHMGYNRDGTLDSRGSPDYDYGTYPYSTSVPVTSPLRDH
eukprot:GHVU01220964.1.p1 GENE.GHVU01220964.1~~GHVU01220964.1.p1  ORF type:complete len:422 (-),score=43.29 GHVU01220964.1:2851-4068(-)